MFKNIIKYVLATLKWILHGSPTRSKKEIARIYTICEECPFFKKEKGLMKGYDRCGICGCNLHKENIDFNKISYKTEHCPDNPSRW